MGRVLVDVGLLAAAWFCAFGLRFDWEMPEPSFMQCVLTLPYVVMLQYAALTLLRVPSFSWRFVSLHDATYIASGLGAVMLLLLAVRLGVPAFFETPGYWRLIVIPISVILADFAFATLGLLGVRSLRRLHAERTGTRDEPRPTTPGVKTLLIGAGRAGHMLAREIAGRPALGIEPVGFVDDDSGKSGTLVHGTRVLGTTAQLEELRRQTGAAQALITLASARGQDVRRIVALCNDAGLATKIIPSLREIAGGDVQLSQFRDVEIEDLLGRHPVDLDERAWQHVARDRVVLVTGAGGSIGAELCRQVLRAGPAKLVLLDQGETNLFRIVEELRGRRGRTELASCIADICDEERVRSVFAEHRPSTVFHAAAHKHVPLMEANPGEAIKNNVGGTKTLAEIADRFGTAHFVMISTDKAVNPTSVMGASKRIAELYVQALNANSATKMACVRFGNVLDSAGSVIPTFREQIRHGGPVTVTHREMRRYFMTIPEACQLVLQAAGIGAGGEIFVLDMGEPVRILDLAREMIRLSGLTPDDDVRIELTGLRPGEKLAEELAGDGETLEPTSCAKVLVASGARPAVPLLGSTFDQLLEAAEAGAPDHLRRLIQLIVPEYRPWRERPAGPEADRGPKARGRSQSA